jgi:O-antigen ligase
LAEVPLTIGLAVVAAFVLGPLIGWAAANIRWDQPKRSSTVLFALLVGIPAMPVLIRWPVVSTFGLYAFLVPFDSVALITDTGGATITRLVGIVAAGVLLATGLMERRLVRPPLAALWVVLFFLWAVASLAWTVNLPLAQARLPTAASLVAMYLVAVSFRVSERELTTVYVLTVLGGAVAAAAGVVLGFEDGTERAVRGTLAIAGREANPNGVAQSLLLPLGVAVGIFFASRRVWAKAVAVAGVGAIGAGIFLTMSRASLAAMALMICILLYRFRIRWQVLAIIGILTALLPLMPDLFFDRVGSVFSGEDTTGSGRTAIWGVGVRALEQFGWFGAGLSNFPAVYDMYANTPPRGLSRGAHNTFLGTWVESGVVGLVFLLAAVVGHLRTGKRGNESMSEAAFPAVIEAACFGFLVVAFFSGDMLWTKAFWLPWILTVWASRAGDGSTDRLAGRGKSE